LYESTIACIAAELVLIAELICYWNWVRLKCVLLLNCVLLLLCWISILFEIYFVVAVCCCCSIGGCCWFGLV